jgi:hypothetical protein
MPDNLPNCWEILKCERQKRGSKVRELGECVVSIEGMGHSCWVVAGTFCGGEVQGTIAQKLGFCASCEVRKLYGRAMGSKGKEVRLLYPEEDKKYTKIMLIHAKEGT